MGALGRIRRKIEGAEAQAIGEREMDLAIERAARRRGITPTAYVNLLLLAALENDGVIHVYTRGDQLEVCFAPEECSGHA